MVHGRWRLVLAWSCSGWSSGWGHEGSRHDLLLSLHLCTHASLCLFPLCAPLECQQGYADWVPDLAKPTHVHVCERGEGNTQQSYTDPCRWYLQLCESTGLVCTCCFGNSIGSLQFGMYMGSLSLSSGSYDTYLRYRRDAPQVRMNYVLICMKSFVAVIHRGDGVVETLLKAGAVYLSKVWAILFWSYPLLSYYVPNSILEDSNLLKQGGQIRFLTLLPILSAIIMFWRFAGWIQFLLPSNCWVKQRKRVSKLLASERGQGLQALQRIIQFLERFLACVPHEPAMRFIPHICRELVLDESWCLMWRQCRLVLMCKTTRPTENPQLSHGPQRQWAAALRTRTSKKSLTEKSRSSLSEFCVFPQERQFGLILTYSVLHPQMSAPQRTSQMPRTAWRTLAGHNFLAHRDDFDIELCELQCREEARERRLWERLPGRGEGADVRACFVLFSPAFSIYIERENREREREREKERERERTIERKREREKRETREKQQRDKRETRERQERDTKERQKTRDTQERNR